MTIRKGFSPSLMFWAGVVASFLFCGCADRSGESAKILFARADSLYRCGDLNGAKILLDSVLFAYPESAASHEARNLRGVVIRTERERNLRYLDSLLAMREAELPALLKKFAIEDKDAAEPMYLSPVQQPQRALDRCYLRLRANRNGQTTLSSHYAGVRRIGHKAVRVQAGELYCLTDTIADDALNHCFEAGGMFFESLRFAGGADNDAASFVAANWDRKITVSLITGGKPYCYQLSETDRAAIRDVYELAVKLREAAQLRAQIENEKIALNPPLPPTVAGGK